MKILFVSKPGVVHTARWIEQISEQGWDIHLFSPYSTSDLTIHQGIPANVLIHLIVKQKRAGIRQKGLWYPLEKGDRFRLWVTDLYEMFRDRASRLAKLIKESKPDIVHSLEMQGATYLMLEAKKILKKEGIEFPKWIYSSWGSDIYMFGEQKEHNSRIKEALRNIDYLITDCERDVTLAKKFDFSGEVLGVYPTGGGFEIERLQSFAELPVTKRNIISLKGLVRQENTGRALVALEAIEKGHQKLKKSEFVIYQADEEVVKRAERMKKELGLSITYFPPSPHEEFVKLLGRSRISIGMNISDGTPNTMLESMIMGAFPVQSDTVSTGEWITNGENGFLVDPENPAEIAEALVKAAEDDELVERAARYNDRFIKERLERAKIKGEVIDLYEKVYSAER